MDIMKDLQEDNLFRPLRERLGRYEEAPSEELWGKIAASKRKDRNWLFVLESVGIALIGMVLLFGSEVTTEEANKFTKDQAASVTKNEVTTQKTAAPKLETVNNQLETVNGQLETVNTQRPTLKGELSTEPLTSDFRLQTSDTPLQTENRKLPTPDSSVDSTKISSPIIAKNDSSAKEEVIPPYKKPHSRVQLYFSLTPSLSFQKMIPAADDEIIVAGFENRSPMSMKRFGFGIDAGFQKEINRFFEFYGGLSFYRQQQQLTYVYYDRDAEVTRVGDEWIFEINRPKRTHTFDYSMTNLGVSAGLMLTIKGEKLKQKLGTGLMYSYNFKNANYISYKLLYRSELTVNARTSLFIEPNFNYSFVSKEKLSEPFTLKPFRAGISVGLLYRL
jgi:hypothetical protein